METIALLSDWRKDLNRYSKRTVHFQRETYMTMCGRYLGKYVKESARGEEVTCRVCLILQQRERMRV